MPITLAEAKNRSQDKLTDVVIDEFKTSPLLNDMEFDNTVKPQGGKSLTYSYNRITTQPTAAGRAINGEYTAQETKTSKVSVDLKVMGGSYEIDRVLAANENQVVEEVEFQSKQKSKATVAEFHNQVINGDSGVRPTDFDGLNKILTGTSNEVNPAATIDLSDADKIKANGSAFRFMLRKALGKLDGNATHILMNNDMYAAFQSVFDEAHGLVITRDEAGNETAKFGTAKLVVMGSKPGGNTPIIETKSPTGETSIYAVRLAKDGFHGVSPEGDTLIKTYTPDFTAPGAVKKGEVEFVGAAVLKSTKAAVVLRKIKIA